MSNTPTTTPKAGTMARITINIITDDSEQFAVDASAELARMLGELGTVATRDRGVEWLDGLALRDSDGARVGRVNVK